MNDSVGSVALYNIVFIFLIITFAILAGTLSYSKAFRVGTRVITALETYDGYNDLSRQEIDRVMKGFGYKVADETISRKCPTKEGVKAIQSESDLKRQTYFYCVYEFKDKPSDPNDRNYHWGVVTYIYIDIPLVGDLLELPLYATSDSFYRFPKNFPPVQYPGD